MKSCYTEEAFIFGKHKMFTGKNVGQEKICECYIVKIENVLKL